MQESRIINWFLVLVFVYFVTLSADLLQIKLWLFKPKINHLIAVLLFLVVFLSGQFRVMDKTLFVCFLGLLSACCISSLFSCNPLRSLGYAAVAAFSYVMYFLLPLNLFRLFDRRLLLRLYFASFIVIGVHACSQFLCGFFGMIDPFVTQVYGDKLVRAQSWTYEPSYYALFMTPFVVYMNAQFLIAEKKERLSFILIVGCNALLLVSTATSGFFSYFIFLLTCLCLLPQYRGLFPQFFKRICRFALAFLVFCSGIGILFTQYISLTYFKFFNWEFFKHISFRERWERITFAWKTFCEHPLWGTGLGDPEQQLYATTHFNNPHILLHHPTLDMFDTFTMTNVFTEVLASLGLYGISVLLLTIYIMIKKLHMARKNLPRPDQIIIVPLLTSLVVMVLCLQFNQGIFRNYVWVHMAISMGFLFSAQQAQRRTI